MTEAPFNWTDIGVVTHAMGAVASFILFVLMSTSWQGGIRGALLLAAAFLTGVWGVVAALYAGSGFNAWSGAYSVIESVRVLSWLLLLLVLLNRPPADGERRSRLLAVVCALVAILGCAVLSAALLPTMSSIGSVISVDIRIAGHMLLAILGLVLVEQVFQGTAASQRSTMKYICVGVGGLMAYDFFIYSDALLFRRIDLGFWNGRGLIPAIVAPLMAASAGRHQQWSIDLFVSRTAAVYAAALAGSGIYLLIMAAVGYYIQTHGGSWGSAVQAVFLFGALLLLVVMLFSGQLRARARVFFSKHFYSYKYDYRDEWLRFIRTLGANSGADARTGSIRALGQILDCPGGSLWTQDDMGNYRCSGHWHLDMDRPGSVDRNSPLANFLRQRGWIVDLIEFRRDSRRYPELVLPDWLAADNDAWLIVPLVLLDQLHGFLVLEKSATRTSLNWEDHDLLKTAGQQVSSYLALVDASAALARARQFEAYNRFSAYVVHDLKNVAAQLSLVVTNARRHKHNPEFIDDAIEDLTSAAERINRMLLDLRTGNAEETSLSGTAHIEQVLSLATDRRAGQEPAPEFRPMGAELLVAADPERLTTIVEHLVQNAQEATPEFGQVTLSAHREEDSAVIEIADTGCGMDPKFIRERLFEPFDTTKGNAGMGIGVYEAREFVHALAGSMDVHSELGQGSTFRLKIPLAESLNVEPDSPASMGAQV